MHTSYTSILDVNVLAARWQAGRDTNTHTHIHTQNTNPDSMENNKDQKTKNQIYGLIHKDNPFSHTPSHTLSHRHHKQGLLGCGQGNTSQLIQSQGETNTTIIVYVSLSRIPSVTSVLPGAYLVSSVEKTPTWKRLWWHCEETSQEGLLWKPAKSPLVHKNLHQADKVCCWTIPTRGWCLETCYWSRCLVRSVQMKDRGVRRGCHFRVSTTPRVIILLSVSACVSPSVSNPCTLLNSVTMAVILLNAGPLVSNISAMVSQLQHESLQIRHNRKQRDSNVRFCFQAHKQTHIHRQTPTHTYTGVRIGNGVAPHPPRPTENVLSVNLPGTIRVK
jgi:hypothetical protein